MGGAQSTLADVRKGLQEMQAIKCCLEHWASLLDDVASGAIKVDLSAHDLELLNAYRSMPRRIAGLIRISITEHVGALDFSLLSFILLSNRIDKTLADLKASLSALAHPEGGPAPAVAPAVAGGSRARDRALARLIECKASEECKGDPLPRIDDLIERGIRAMRHVHSTMANRFHIIFDIRAKVDPANADPRFEDWDARATRALDLLHDEAKRAVHAYRKSKSRLFHTIRRDLRTAQDDRMDVARTLSTFIAKAQVARGEITLH